MLFAIKSDIYTEIEANTAEEAINEYLTELDTEPQTSPSSILAESLQATMIKL